MFILFNADEENPCVVTCSKDKTKLEEFINVQNKILTEHNQKIQTITSSNAALKNNYKKKFEEWLRNNMQAIRNPEYFRDEKFWENSGAIEWQDFASGESLCETIINIKKETVIKNALFSCPLSYTEYFEKQLNGLNISYELTDKNPPKGPTYKCYPKMEYDKQIYYCLTIQEVEEI